MGPNRRREMSLECNQGNWCVEGSIYQDFLGIVLPSKREGIYEVIRAHLLDCFFNG